MKKGLLWSVIVLIVVSGALFIVLSKKDSDHSANEYDVIVVGGEPEGVAAAVSAARNGAKTLLIEKRGELGGLFTYGMLNFLDIPQGEDGHSVSRGIFQEWHQLVGGQSAFGIEQAKTTFRKLVEDEPNITLVTEANVTNVIIENSRVTAVEYEQKEESYIAEGKTFIDATQDADFAVMAGVPYFIGGEDINIKDKKMAVTLMIHLKNVDWEGIKHTAQSELFGPAEVTETAAWGFVKLTHVYEPVEENTRLRGLNLAKVGDDYYINALQIFGVDGLSEESKREGIERGKREIDSIVNYLQQEFPGFENAEIASYPEELYVRETRHIQAEYQLPMSDVWTNKDHWDNIGYGAYPVDIQAQTPQDYGYVVADPKQYAIPFRSLVPKEVDGLLVVGRSSGYSSIAAGSARVVPTGMTTGEAAGAAAMLAIQENMTFREMTKNESVIETLRGMLSEQGAFVEHIDTSYPYEGEWFDSAIQTLINYGVIFGKYENDMNVDDTTTNHQFIKLLSDSIQRANPELYKQHENTIRNTYDQIINEEEVTLTRDLAATILFQMLAPNATSTSWASLQEHQFIDESLIERVPDDRNLLIKEVFAIVATVINQ